MAVHAASRVLADSVGPGGTAALVVLVLIVACIGIFVALLGSLKRLRGNVNKGTFNTDHTSEASRLDAADDAGPPTGTAEPAQPATRDRKGRAGGGA